MNVKKRHAASAVRKPQRNFAQNLWLYRKRMGYTQKQVAFLIGHRTAAHISSYERGKRIPKLETALSLEIALCVPVAFLYRDLYLKLKEEIQRRRESLPTT